MQEWMKISLMLCTFGFLKELRPSEPFIVDFLTGPWRNVTADEVYSKFQINVVVFFNNRFLSDKSRCISSGNLFLPSSISGGFPGN